MEKTSAAILLAAGNGVRMFSEKPKVLHTVCGRTLIEHVIHAVQDACTLAPLLVVGNGADAVRASVQSSVQFVEQAERLGTGHAVLCASHALQGKRGTVWVIACDTPLVRTETLEALRRAVTEDGCALAMMSVHMQDPTGYGRIVRDAAGNLTGVVEHRDCTPEQLAITEANILVYCFDIEKLLAVLPRIGCDNAKKEYYLTDAVKLLLEDGERVEAIPASAEEAIGINDRAALYEAECAMRKRILHAHRLAGVTILDDNTTLIDVDVQLGRDVTIYPNNTLMGETVIADGVTLYPGNRISNSKIGRNTTLEHSVVLDSQIGERCTVGPFAYLRPHSHVSDACRIGDFVELKNVNIGQGSKVSHLSYLGDADVGAGVNVGCGVVFVNYDGKHKRRSQVDDAAFIGCNVNLIAPVHVGAQAYIAAGTTLTEDVPSGALSIGRVRQTNKPGWVGKRKQEGKL